MPTIPWNDFQQKHQDSGAHATELLYSYITSPEQDGGMGTDPTTPGFFEHFEPQFRQKAVEFGMDEQAAADELRRLHLGSVNPRRFTPQHLHDQQMAEISADYEPDDIQEHRKALADLEARIDLEADGSWRNPTSAVMQRADAVLNAEIEMANLDPNLAEALGAKPETLKEILKWPFSKSGVAIMEVAEKIDRVQDATFAAWEGVLTGQSGQEIWDRSLGVLKGEEVVPFSRVIQHFDPGVRDVIVKVMQEIDEIPAELDQVLYEVAGEELATDIHRGLFNIEKAIKWKGATLPWFREDPNKKFDHFKPKEKKPLLYEKAIERAGTIGDFTLDPLMLTGMFAGKVLSGGSALVKAAKAASGTRRLGLYAAAGAAKTAGVAMDPIAAGFKGTATGIKAANAAAMKASPAYNKFMRQTLVRGFAHPEMNEKFAAALDKKGLHKYETYSIAADLKAETDLLREVAGEDVWRAFPSLAENGEDIDNVIDMVRLIETGTMPADEILGESLRIQNPQAVKLLIGTTEEQKQQVINAVKAHDNFTEQMIESANKVGMHIGTFANRLQKVQDQQFNDLADIIPKVLKKEAEKIGAQIDERVASVMAKEQVIKASLGDRAFREALYNASNAPVPYDESEMWRKLAGAVAENQAASMHWVTPEKPLIEYLTDNIDAAILNGARNNEALQKAFDNIHKAELNIYRQPKHFAHMASADAVFQMEQRGVFQSKGVRSAMADPRTHSDFQRAFIDNEGVPLSIEQIEDIVSKGKFGKLTNKGDSWDASGADTYMLIEKGDYLHKKPGFWKRIRGKVDEEQAAFWETDVDAVIEARTRDHVESLTSGEFLSKSLERWTKSSPEEIGLDAIKVSDLDGSGVLFGKFPGYADKFIDRRVGEELLRATERFFTPQANKFLSMYDTATRYFVSHTLFPFMPYHMRNQGGGLMLHSMAGVMDDPRYWRQDLEILGFGKRVQALASKGTLPSMDELKNLKITVNGRDFDGAQFYRTALRTGVARNNLMGSIFEDANKFTRKPGQRVNPLDLNHFAPIAAGRKVAQWIDEGDRLGSFAWHLSRGHSIKQSAALTKKFFGSFHNELLTPFERDVMKRLMPFYSWLRFNLPIQVEQLATNPKYRYKFTTARRLQETQEQQYPGETEKGMIPHVLSGGGLPDSAPASMRKAGAEPVAFDDGQLIAWGTEANIPVADVGNLMQGGRDFGQFLLSSMNPAVQLPLEYIFNRDLMSDAEFENRKSEFFGRRHDSYKVNAIRGTFRFINELERSGLVPDLIRAIERMAPEEAQETIQKITPQWLRETHVDRAMPPLTERMLSMLLGARVYSFDVGTATDRMLREQTGRLNTEAYRWSMYKYHKERAMNEMSTKNPLDWQSPLSNPETFEKIYGPEELEKAYNRPRVKKE
jgi:hypothetical protein